MKMMMFITISANFVGIGFVGIGATHAIAILFAKIADTNVQIMNLVEKVLAWLKVVIVKNGKKMSQKKLNDVLLSNLYAERQLAISSGNALRLAIIEARIKELKKEMESKK